MASWILPALRAVLPHVKTIYDTAIEHLTQLMEKREELELRRDSLDREISVVKELIFTASAYVAENPYERDRPAP